MGVTSRGFRYPDLTDAPNVPIDLQELAEDVQTEFDSNLTLGGNLTVPGSLNLGAGSLSMLPLSAIKTSDESVTSSTTLQNDDHLVIALPAITATWWLDAILILDAGLTGDFKMDFTGPAGCTCRLSGLGDSIGNTGSSTEISHQLNAALSEQFNFGGFASGGGTPRPIKIGGIVKNAGTAGNLQLRFAQITSNSTPTKLLSQSFMSLSPRS